MSKFTPVIGSTCLVPHLAGLGNKWCEEDTLFRVVGIPYLDGDGGTGEVGIRVERVDDPNVDPFDGMPVPRTWTVHPDLVFPPVADS